MLTTEKDEEMREMAKMELETLETQQEQLEEEIKACLFRPTHRIERMPWWKSAQGRRR